jgi:bifunctional non-homologous end joining protein LigD
VAKRTSDTSRSTRKSDSRASQQNAPELLRNARRGNQPDWLAPQLATLSKTAPDGDEWQHEIKFDGYRILIIIRDGAIRFFSRNAKDWTAACEPLMDAVRRVRVRQAILDGELVTLDEKGISRFQRMQNARVGGSSQLVYYAFDLPWCEGYDLTRCPLVERRALLAKLLSGLKSSDAIRFSEHTTGNGPTVFRHACRLGAEGIISKLTGSPYESKRTRTWLKVKCVRGQEFVIGGFSEPEGSRTGFGALLLGVYDDHAELVFCGRVGTGFTEALLMSILREMKKRETTECPFTKNRPRGADARGVHWLRPELVCEVEFAEWTGDGILRHPSFKGLRADKDPREVRREKARIG